MNNGIDEKVAKMNADMSQENQSSGSFNMHKWEVVVI